MANEEHLARLKQSVEDWNKWRERNPKIRPDLIRANLQEANLLEADLSRANLIKANLSKAYLIKTNLSRSNLFRANLGGANLYKADLRNSYLINVKFNRSFLTEANLEGTNLLEVDFSRAHLINSNLSRSNLSRSNLEGANLFLANLLEANLSRAHLVNANFSRANLEDANLEGADLEGASLYMATLNRANLSNANLSGAYLYKSNLTEANLKGANLCGANLENALLVEANLELADLRDCSVYGMCSWRAKLDSTKQTDLVITPRGENIVTVDDLDVAQSLELLLNNEKVRSLIDTINAKIVLILGHFEPGRKWVLDGIRQEVRRRGLSPILFDFAKPIDREVGKLVFRLFQMARFVIADISNANGVVQELERIVPLFPTTPLKPLLLRTAGNDGILEQFRHYPWFLDVYVYENHDDLLASLVKKVIVPAEAKAKELLRNKGMMEITSVA